MLDVPPISLPLQKFIAPHNVCWVQLERTSSVKEVGPASSGDSYAVVQGTDEAARMCEERIVLCSQVVILVSQLCQLLVCHV
jgi:hypothetical protein